MPEGLSSASLALAEVTDRRILELAAWPGGQTFLRERTAAWQAAGATVLPVAANRAWVVGEWVDEPADSGDGPVHADLSDAQVTWRLTGSERFRVLGRLLPVDLDAGSFPAGGVVTSHIRGITVTVHNSAQFLDVYVRRSLAQSLRYMLEHAAALADGNG